MGTGSHRTPRQPAALCICNMRPPGHCPQHSCFSHTHSPPPGRHQGGKPQEQPWHPQGWRLADQNEAKGSHRLLTAAESPATAPLLRCQTDVYSATYPQGASVSRQSTLAHSRAGRPAPREDVSLKPRGRVTAQDGPVLTEGHTQTQGEEMT